MIKSVAQHYKFLMWHFLNPYHVFNLSRSLMPNGLEDRAHGRHVAAYLFPPLPQSAVIYAKFFAFPNYMKFQPTNTEIQHQNDSIMN